MTRTQQLKALRKIRVEARLLARGYGSRAFLPASVGLILGGIIVYLLDGALLHFYPSLMLVGMIVGGVVGYKATKRKDRAAFIYECLTAYQPLDEKAYRDLQALARGPKMSAVDILAWVDHETKAIQPREPSPEDIARQRFVAR